MKTSEQTNELFTALSKAQSEMGVAKEDGFNKHLGAGYASIDSLQAAYREPCAKNGLVIIQNVFSEGESYFLETRLAHSSGQWMASSMKVLLAKQDMQSLGAAVTYAKRYAITSLLGISTEVDEDAVQEVKQKTQVSNQKLNAAVQRNVDLKQRLAADTRPIMNHATGEVRQMPVATEKSLDASANPKTGTVAVSKLVENMKPQEPKSTAPIDLNSWDHMISFGKYSGKTIRDVGYTNAKEYMAWMETQAGGKKLSPSAEALKVALSKI